MRISKLCVVMGLLVLVTEAKFRSTLRDGKVVEGEAKPGTAIWAPAVIHSWECLGPGEQRTIITELKGGAKP